MHFLAMGIGHRFKVPPNMFIVMFSLTWEKDKHTHSIGGRKE